jgi:flagellar protein FlaG
MNIDSLSAGAGTSHTTTPEPRALVPAAGGATSRAPQSARPGDGKAAPQLDVALEAVNRFLQPVATSLRFVKDESSGRIIVRVIDADTQKVLRQMPSEDVLAMNQALDRLQGLIIRDRV